MTNQERIREILASIKENPYPDGQRTRTVPMFPLVFFERREDDYTIRYGVERVLPDGDQAIKVYSITPTAI